MPALDSRAVFALDREPAVVAAVVNAGDRLLARKRANTQCPAIASRVDGQILPSCCVVKTIHDRPDEAADCGLSRTSRAVNNVHSIRERVQRQVGASSESIESNASDLHENPSLGSLQSASSVD